MKTVKGTAASRVFECSRPGDFVDGLGGSSFDDLPMVHDQDKVANVLDHSKIMRNEQIRNTQLILQILQKIDDLSLDAHIESADRLIANNETRLDGQGPGNADSLPLTATNGGYQTGHLRAQGQPASRAQPRTHDDRPRKARENESPKPPQ